jgi:hypothetical protein
MESPKQYKNDDISYAAIDEYLKGLQGADPDELVTHLIRQIEAYEFEQLGPVLKAIVTIRALIEDQNADPDTLIKARQQEEQSEHDVSHFLEGLLGKKRKLIKSDTIDASTRLTK